MRILIVEDDSRLLLQLDQYMQSQGFSVDLADDGEKALYQLKEYNYDLAIIDVGLPSIDGFEVVKQARASDISCPIIILTARDRWQEKVKGLESGADDYLTKPFVHEELLARVKALIRRSAGQASPILQKGPLSLDTSANQLYVNEQAIELTAYEYKVIEYLMMNPSKVVSKTEMVEHIYDQDFDLDSNVIEVFVGRLRRKIDKDNLIKPIETLRGRGYRLNASLR
ncbi:response regulator transcription factor [Brumicola nitratireducens]|uniref:Response regulator in two-component regulatory system with PhoQ n=1 Tax=Glaciecola nitratireducens (strain JCM 12485 / KCTC 12276 / FR1064) TaxID=1085623 RepID=G4QL74_GLANF|nr:response regulator transcription factor [Glaciecola nitratireducens]AEP29545.1 response regulator in two-component regulatory system with PhoQ [Glaciecola nitratireducens FR1064]